MSGGTTKDNVVISFHDVCLRESDCHLLTGHHWLNDNIISFCFEYFRQVKSAVNVESSSSFCFISPEIVQLCKFSDLSTLREIFRVLNPQNCELVFLPINDNESSVQAGGSHWSLLVYRKTTRTFYHYDSMGEGTANFGIARQMCDTIYKLMTPGDSQRFELINVTSSAQANSYDCGVYLLIFTEKISSEFNEPLELGDLDDIKRITAKDADQYRKDLLKIIGTLK